MKGTPQRQALEESLKYERVGSPKIQALADYAMRKDVEWRSEHRPAKMNTLEERQLIAKKAVAEHHIDMWKVSRDVDVYFEAFDNAEAILKPYIAIDNPYISPYQIFLDDLAEINLEKSRK